MSVFALVHNSTGWVRAAGELSDFLSFRKRPSHVLMSEPLLGLWIEPSMMEKISCALTMSEIMFVGQPVRIRETVSLSGLWVLCWIEAMDETGKADLCRHDLLGALIELTGRERVAAEQFIPVFPSDAVLSEVQTEMRDLDCRYPNYSSSPVYQDHVTGRLLLPDVREASPRE